MEFSKLLDRNMQTYLFVDSTARNKELLNTREAIDWQTSNAEVI
jgi:hypothetical protein